MAHDTFFIDTEKKWLKQWVKHGIIHKYLTKNKNASKRFSFLDGPITANNPMGVHHAWGRTYKDLWQKFYNLLGYKQRFQNGFDCQGLWVEVEVEKELGIKSKKDIENLVPGNPKQSIAKFVQLCKDRVKKFSDIQTEQSQRLGYFMDWDNSYYTMSDENNYMIWRFLKTCHVHGWIYKGYDSVPWCPRCGTAISQHEILTEDYAEITHETVYFKLKIQNTPDELQKKFSCDASVFADKQVYFLAWTTTPWTIPGNVALAVNPEFTYVLVSLPESEDQSQSLFILEEERAPHVFKKETYDVLATFSGKKCIGMQYQAAFDHLPRVQDAQSKQPGTFHTVVNGKDMVTNTEGTGILHVAPGQGQEDFQLGKKEQLSIIDLIGEDASYHDGLGELSGKNAKEKPGLIFSHLKTYQEGAFFYKTESYRHRYPRCWRCKTELVWRVVDEWYIAMDKASSIEKDKRTLRQRMMDVAKKIHWIPSFGLDRELDWLKNMHDWMISKKRFWGLALPIWVSEDGEEFEVIGSNEELEHRAVEGWDSFKTHSPHKPYIDEIIIESPSGKKMKRIPDVGNVWLDAGIVPFSTIWDEGTHNPAYIYNEPYFHNWFPVDFITESFPGQFKNWFYSMIAMSTVLQDTNPFKTVLGFATMVDEKGKPFHKSAGNAIEFVQGADTYGADLIRWVVASSNPSQNILFGENTVNDMKRRFYLTIWNVFKFFKEYAEIDGISYTSMKHTKKTLLSSSHVLDIWILHRFTDTIRYAKKELKEYRSQAACHSFEEFVRDLSTWYVRRSRERVWIHTNDTKDRNQFYTTLHYILVNLSIAVSPMVPFLSEEMYTELTEHESVHLAEWPKEIITTIDENIIRDMAHLRNIVEIGHRVRKELKIKVRQPLASLTITVPKSDAFVYSEHIDQYVTLLMDELNVKHIAYQKGKGDQIECTYDTVLSDELVTEGKLRDLIRTIQSERKKKGITINQKISLTVPKMFEPYLEIIQNSIYTDKITFGDDISIE